MLLVYYRTYKTRALDRNKYPRNKNTNILFSETKISISTFDTFKTLIETSRTVRYGVVYLMKNKKSLVLISEFHLANYRELKSSIETKISNLGYVLFCFFPDWKTY
jgi:hypothetical protein